MAVAHVVMGIPSDRRVLAVARRRLGHLFPHIPRQSAYPKRRNGLREAIDWLAGVFAAQSPGYRDDLVLLDSTRSSALGAWRLGRLWLEPQPQPLLLGMRLHLACAPDGTPRRAKLGGADRKEREVALDLLPDVRRGGELVVCDKGYVGRGFKAAVAALGGIVVRPARTDEPEGSRPRLGRFRQRIESVFQTFKDIFSLERHGGRTPRACVPHRRRILALAAAASGSIISPGDRAARSWPTWPERVESII